MHSVSVNISSVAFLLNNNFKWLISLEFLFVMYARVKFVCVRYPRFCFCVCGRVCRGRFCFGLHLNAARRFAARAVAFRGVIFVSCRCRCTVSAVAFRELRRFRFRFTSRFSMCAAAFSELRVFRMRFPGVRFRVPRVRICLCLCFTYILCGRV